MKKIIIGLLIILLSVGFVSAVPNPTLISKPTWVFLSNYRVLNPYQKLYSIVGEEQPLVGSSQTYTIDLSVSTPVDDDYTDKTFAVRWGNWALIDENQNIIEQGDWEEVNQNYHKEVTITIPNNPSKYVLLGVIVENKAVWNDDTNSWDWQGEEVLSKEALSITTSLPVPVKPSITFSFTDLLSKIWNWFLNLFR